MGDAKTTSSNSAATNVLVSWFNRVWFKCDPWCHGAPWESVCTYKIINCRGWSLWMSLVHQPPYHIWPRHSPWPQPEDDRRGTGWTMWALSWYTTVWSHWQTPELIDSALKFDNVWYGWWIWPFLNKPNWMGKSLAKPVTHSRWRIYVKLIAASNLEKGLLLE